MEHGAAKLLLGLLATTAIHANPAFAQSVTPATPQTGVAPTDGAAADSTVANDTNSDSATASPAQASDNVGDIIVTAQRRSERLHDVPLTVQSVSSDTLARSGITSLRDIQNVVSGVTFGGTGNLSQPAIRGLSTTVTVAGAENGNALYIDGVYQPTQSLLNSDLPDVDRIEVLKGPQGTLFGRNSIGGAIQVFTRAPSFTPAAFISIEEGAYLGSGSSRSALHSNVRAYASGPLIADAVAYSVSGGYNYTPGYLTDDTIGKRTGEIRQATVRGKLLIQPTSNFRIDLTGFYISNRTPGQGLVQPYRGLTAATQYPGSIIPTEPWHVAFNDDPADTLNQTVRTYGGSGSLRLTNSLGVLSSITAYAKTNVTNAANIIGGTFGSLPCLLNGACIDFGYTLNQDTFSQEVNFASRDFGAISFTTGLFYYHSISNVRNQFQGALASISPVFPLLVLRQRTQTDAYAGYGELKFVPVTGLNIIAGLRYNHERLRDVSFLPATPVVRRTFNALTPRLSVLYDLTSRLNVYGTFSKGFKSGLSGVSNAASVPPFAPVAPERLNAYEVGAKYASRNLNANLSVFYYDYRNKQEQVLAAGTSSSVIVQNTGPVRIFGIDADATVRLTPALTFRVAGSWLPTAKYRNFPDAVGTSTTRVPFDPAFPPFNCPAFGGCGGFTSIVFNASGQRLIRAPRLTSNATLTYEADGFDASVTGSYSTSAKHDITGTVVQGGYGTVAATIGYTFDDGLRIGVYGRNLTNAVYIQSALTSSAGFSVAYGQPREAGLSATYRF